MIGTVFEVPYFNSLTAGEFDASSSFDANMPASHVAYSLQTLGLYLSPGQTVRPDVLQWGDVQTIGTDLPPPLPSKAQVKCGQLDIYCHLTEFIGSDLLKDYSKRIALVLVALILIVVAILKLK